MRVFISHRFTGEDIVSLKQVLSDLKGIINAQGFDAYCSLDSEDHFVANSFTVSEIMRHALGELEASDVLLAIVTSDNKSEGMLIEVGYALAKGKKIILAKKSGLQTPSLDSVSDHVIEYGDISELENKLLLDLCLRGDNSVDKI